MYGIINLMKKSIPLWLGVGIIALAAILAGWLLYHAIVNFQAAIPLASPQSSATVQHSATSTASSALPAVTSQPSPLVNQQFQFPYPVSWIEHWSYTYNNVDWEDASTSFDLTGVAIGAVTSTDQVALTFKINNTVSPSSQETSNCVPLYIRRVLDEQGDLQAPDQNTWTLPGDYCVQGNQAYFNQIITFPIMASETSFLFTTGGTSNIYFEIAVINGTLKVQQLASGIPNGD
jgi:hypothetical protein